MSDFIPEKILKNYTSMEDIWHYIDFDIYAVSGPIQVGDMGNVRGDADGFFIGVYWGGEINIGIEELNSYKAAAEISEKKTSKARAARDRSLFKRILNGELVSKLNK